MMSNLSDNQLLTHLNQLLTHLNQLLTHLYDKPLRDNIYFWGNGFLKYDIVNVIFLKKTCVRSEEFRRWDHHYRTR
jgi:hypothetical protein